MIIFVGLAYLLVESIGNHVLCIASDTLFRVCTFGLWRETYLHAFPFSLVCVCIVGDVTVVLDMCRPLCAARLLVLLAALLNSFSRYTYVYKYLRYIIGVETLKSRTLPSYQPTVLASSLGCKVAFLVKAQARGLLGL